jgi:hypothetical protein
MTIAGTIKNGVVLLDNAPPLADGTRVEVFVPILSQAPDESQEPTLRSLLKFAGRANNLPADMAEQHDHYIHGTPKR